MENVLKLTIKKDVFTSVLNGASEVSFEVSSFYMGKFTTNKNFTVEDLTDKSVWKSYDGVQFTTSGVDEKLVYELTEICVSDDKTSFIVKFNQTTPVEETNPVEEVVEETEPVVEETPEVVEETVETGEPIVEEVPEKTEEVVEEVVEETHEEVKEDNVESSSTSIRTDLPLPDKYVEAVLKDFYEYPDVICVNTPRVVVGYNGRILAYNKTLLWRNGHEIIIDSFHDVEIKYDDLLDTLQALTYNRYVFVCPKKTVVKNGIVKLCLVSELKHRH